MKENKKKVKKNSKEKILVAEIKVYLHEDFELQVCNKIKQAFDTKNVNKAINKVAEEIGKEILFNIEKEEKEDDIEVKVIKVKNEKDLKKVIDDIINQHVPRID